jgi:hypothetical protein
LVPASAPLKEEEGNGTTMITDIFAKSVDEISNETKPSEIRIYPQRDGKTVLSAR